MIKKSKHLMMLMSIAILSFICVFFSCIAHNQVFASEQIHKYPYEQKEQTHHIKPNFDIASVGTLEDPFIINSVSDLIKLSEDVLNGQTFINQHFKVHNDVTYFELIDFIPIGSATTPFEGSFDGNHAVFDVTIDKPLDNHLGLFGYVKGGTIENLSVVGSIKGRNFVGGIVGYLHSGLVKDVFNQATIFGEINVGGIVGYQLNGTVSHAFNTGNITATTDFSGGITGYVRNGTIEYTYNTAEILANRYAGGLCGYAYGISTSHSNTIIQSYSRGTVSTNNGFTDGLIGGDSNPNGRNIRQHLYFDVTVMAIYQSDYSRKPVLTPTEKTLSTEDFIKMNLLDEKLDHAWDFIPLSENEGYYPILKRFKELYLDEVKNSAIQSVTIEITEGIGSPNYPFILKNSDDLFALSDKVLLGMSFLNVHFKMAEGIDVIYLNDFRPIGISNTLPFEGSFNGNGVRFHIVIDQETLSNQGLFGYIRNSKIENLSISGHIKGYNYVGSVVGYMFSGEIINVYNTAKIHAVNQYAGGIVGHIQTGYISQTFNRGEILARQYAAGLVGSAYALSNTFQNSITQSYSAGLVSSVSLAAGLIALNTTPSGSTNVRTNIYYDVFILSTYQQPFASKPSTVESAQGVNTTKFLDDPENLLGFSDQWIRTPKNNEVGFYPQLSIFHHHNHESIVQHSLNSTEVDLSLGIGTKTLPFIISSTQAIHDLSDMVSKGTTFENLHFKIAEGITNIELFDFKPIGAPTNRFKGSFDGNFATFHLEINQPTLDFLGLFGYTELGTIQNLSVKGFVFGRDNVGGVVGYRLSGSIFNVSNHAQIKARNFGGGIVGRNEGGDFSYVYNTGKVEITGSHAGGITGYLRQGVLAYAYNRAEIIGAQAVGGIVGSTVTVSDVYLNSVISVYSAGFVSANSVVGGVIGSDPANIRYRNIRENLYYDYTILINYVQPRSLKPQITPSEQGLAKSEMIENGLLSKGFPEDIFIFLPTSGNTAYYPQFKTFHEHPYANIHQDSMSSVLTTPLLGEGSLISPFLIYSAKDMINLSSALLDQYDTTGLYFKVGNGVTSIDLSGTSFKPIGHQITPFSGHFDGNFVTFKIDMTSDENYQALFGMTSQLAVIKNFAVIGHVSGSDYVSGVAAYHQGHMESVYSNVAIFGHQYVGGLTGFNQGNIELSYHIGHVLGTSYVGGISGFNEGSIKDVYSSATVNGLSYLGGISGSDIGNILNAYYDQTRISTCDHDLLKPDRARSNLEDNQNVKGLTKTQMQSFSSIGTQDHQMDFNPTHWTTKQTQGWYGYFPQLNAFAAHENIVVKNLSEISVQSLIFRMGQGLKEDPYIIFDALDMKAISDISKGENLLGIFFKISDDVNEIDLSSTPFVYEPIGPSLTLPFRGGFDGNDKTVFLNLTKGGNYQGLFGVLGENASVSNLRIKGYVKGHSYTGSLAGAAIRADISHIYNEATIEGYNYTGGIIGDLKHVSMMYVYNLKSVTGTQHFIGGISGYALNTSIEHVFNFGSIRGNQYIGGLIGNGDTSTHVKNSFNRGSVIGSGAYVGGILGHLKDGSIENIYNASIVRGTNISFLGGLIGRVTGFTIENNAYYDVSIIESDIAHTSLIPIRSIGNKLDQENLKGVEKSMLTGAHMLYGDLSFNTEAWHFMENDGLYAYYPQLSYFAQSHIEVIKADALNASQTHAFSGSGTSTQPYVITNALDMQRLSLLVKEGFNFDQVYFIVLAKGFKIDLSNQDLNYQPIGNTEFPFQGIFNGLGTEFILNNNQLSYHQGLFGVIGEMGEVYNLLVTGSLNGDQYVGSIAGLNYGMIHTVYARAQVKGNAYVGGLVGMNYGTLFEAFFMGEVKGHNQYVGGLIGYNHGRVHDTYVSSTVEGQSFIGGIIGYQELTGVTTMSYYNKDVIDEHVATLNKPIQAISNSDDQEKVIGVNKQRLTAAQLGDSLYQIDFSTHTSWLTLSGEGFFMFYPQLSYFGSHSQSVIKQTSYLITQTMRFSEGDGSKANPYLISNAHDMNAISQMVRQNNTLQNMHFKVKEGIEHIDLSDPGLDYKAIGNQSVKFQGHFDGNFAQFKLNIHTNDYYQGLFGWIGAMGVVSNLSTTGSVYSLRFAGGIAGRNEGKITQVYNLANVHAMDLYAGGIVGYNQGYISHTFNQGHILTTRNYYVGGITGVNENSGFITHSYNRGFIETHALYAGGISGMNNGEITHTYNIGEISGGSSGALIGVSSTQSVIASSYYCLESLMRQTHVKKPTRAIFNRVDQTHVKGVYKNQFTGHAFYGIDLDVDAFSLRENNGYRSYHPELKVFSENAYEHVQTDSMFSTEKDLFYGQGMSSEPYIIYSVYDILALQVLVSKGVDTLDVYFKSYEENMIFDVSFINFEGIGNQIHHFNGVFDGLSARIVLKMNHVDQDYVGLFNVIGESAQLKHFSVEGSVLGRDYVGGAVGYTLGKLSHIMSFVHVNGRNYTGGITGYLNSEGIGLSSHQTIKGHAYVGGLIGYMGNEAHVTYSYNHAKVYATQNFLGGITGYQSNQSHILDTYNHGEVHGEGNYVGGLVGSNYGTISRAYNTSHVTGYQSYVGGLVGINYGSINEAYHTGKIIAIAHVGGVAAQNHGNMESVYYNKTLIEVMIVPHGFITPIYAIDAIEDTEHVKGLDMTSMIGLSAIGNHEKQMNFEQANWHLKEGFDFISFFPEHHYFKDHSNPKIASDSLKSVTFHIMDGQGTELNPYIIYDGYDLLTISIYVSREITFTHKYFKVHDSVSYIDLTNVDFTYQPIGTNQSSFNGIIDFNHINIILDLKNTHLEYQGLFHTLGEQSEIKNLTISGSIKGKSYVGSVAGRNLGSITHVTNFAQIISDEGNDIGGITGFNQGVIRHAINKGQVVMHGTYGGGITGQNEGLIEDSFNHASVFGTTIIGGIAGRNAAQIFNTYNKGHVKGQTIVGGIAGDHIGEITYSFNMGKVEALLSISGGIAGLMHNPSSISLIHAVYNTGHVISHSILAGGIVGHLQGGLISQSYHGGFVEGKSEIGTLIGQMIGGSTEFLYYDLNQLETYEPNQYQKPKQGISNILDEGTVKGLYRGQMAGQNSIGPLTSQMNFSQKEDYAFESSYDTYSFYPQFHAFKHHVLNEVKADSLESVRMLTFILGDGTKQNPFIISNRSDLIALAQNVNSGNSYLNVYFEMDTKVSVLDLYDLERGYVHIPIGNEHAPFRGSFNGQGAHIIINIESQENYQGLFGHIGLNGHVYNVSVSGSVSGNDYVGGIAGYNQGVISEVYNNITLYGRNYVGGIAGYHSGHISNAYNKGDITGELYVGGISGYSKGMILNTYQAGVIYGQSHIGAISGFIHSGEIQRSYYDLRVLNAYRDLLTHQKPKRAISNAMDSIHVKGLDHRFMIGGHAIGSDLFKMDFLDENGVWTVAYNIDGQTYYPQLKVFSRHQSEQVKSHSKISVTTKFQQVFYNYNGATEQNHFVATYVLPSHAYQLVVPFKFGFEFIGWFYIDDEHTFIQMTDSNGLSLLPYDFNENIELVASYQPAYHWVYFLDGQNEVVFEIELSHGAYVEIPQDIIPIKHMTALERFTFIQWDFDFSNRITAKTYIHATYLAQPRMHRLTYMDGNNEFYQDVWLDYNLIAQPLEQIPSKQHEADLAYKFIGWDFDFTVPITQNHIIHPLFEAVPRFYEVRFFDGNGSLLKLETVEFFKHATPPLQVPTQTQTVSHTFEFSHWDQTFNHVESHVDIHPIFHTHDRYYEVIFRDGQLDAMDVILVKYGDSANPPLDIPIKSAQGDTAYRFTGWNHTLETIASDLIVDALFEAVDRYYEVIFLNGNDEILYQITVEYLESLEHLDLVPTKLQTDRHVYIFDQWQEDLSRITHDLTVHPIFIELDRFYMVTFLDGNGNIFDEQLILYQEDAAIPENIPHKDAYGEVAYQFISWEIGHTQITQDVLIEPIFLDVQRYYFVTFYGYDLELVLYTDKVEYGQSAMAPEAPMDIHPLESHTYYFIAWDQDISFIDQNLEVYAIYGMRLKTFEVTFIFGEHSISQLVNYNEDAVAPTAYLEGNDQMSYVFTGWDLSYQSVVKDMVIHALFDEVYLYYIVTFFDGNGLLMKTEHVLPNQGATSPTATPLKSSSETHIYQFSGWHRNFDEVTANIEVHAEFEAINRYYEVVFKDAQGITISHQIIEFEHAAVEPTHPIKPSSSQFDYMFTDWSFPFDYVTQSLEIHPIYQEHLRTYEVVFRHDDGTILSRQWVNYGQSALAPDHPVKPAEDQDYYLFDSWDRPFYMITGNTLINPIFIRVERYYEVIFLDRLNQVLHTQMVEYGQDAIDPMKSLPFEVLDDAYVYAIIGWNQPLTHITQSIEVHAVYDTRDRYYDVIFYDEDGMTILSYQTVEYLCTAIEPLHPIKPDTLDKRYEFLKWSDSFDDVTSNLHIYAEYLETDRSFTVVFIDGDGNVFDEQIVLYGLDASIPDGMPLKSYTFNQMFTFTHWDHDLKNIKENLTVYALFSSSPRTFHIRFLDEGGLLIKEEVVLYGLDATPPMVLPIESTVQYDFIVTWSHNYVHITHDMEITLIYKPVLRNYTYTFYDVNHVILKTVIAPYGSPIIAPTIPIKPSTERYDYHFIGWNKEVPDFLSQNIEFSPYYEEKLRVFEVVFLDGNDDVFETIYVTYGLSGVLPLLTPEKNETSQYYYHFVMWESSPTAVKNNLVIRPVFDRFLQWYQVTFVDEFDTVLKVQLVEYGTGATEPTSDLIPVKESTQQYTFAFSGWDISFSHVTKDITVKTIYNSSLRTYTYTFYHEDGVTIIKQKTEFYGSPIIEPSLVEKPEHEGIVYHFVGWNQVVSDTLTHDVVYVSVFEEALKVFQVIFYDGNGTPLEVQMVNYGQSATVPTNIPTKTSNEMFDYTFSGWIGNYISVKEDLDVIPNFSQSLRVYKVSFVNDLNQVTDVYIEYGKSAVGKVVTPHKTGYRFDHWDQDVSFVTSDLVVFAQFLPNEYQITFHGTYADLGYMESNIRFYDSTVTLPSNTYERRGYYFAGWKTQTMSETVDYLDQDTFLFNHEGLDLYAAWIPIIYHINYVLEGGQADNPTQYTIEDRVILNDAVKADYKFIGWFLKSVETQSMQVKHSTKRLGVMSTDDEQLDLIEEGNIGNITLVARYKYDGYIVLKEASTLGLFYAEITSILPIEYRDTFDQSNPVYLMGVFLGQTIGNLRENFVNENLVFLDKNGNPLDEQAKVATGQQIVILDETNPAQLKDQVFIVLKGDINGDGVVNLVDYSFLVNHIRRIQEIKDIYLLAAMINDDDKVNLVDFSMMIDHIRGIKLIHDPNKENTFLD